MTVAEVADVVGGETGGPAPDRPVDGPPTVDSRAVPAGGLFVATVGERADGHDHAAAAVAAGASAALVSRPVDVPHVRVDDVVAALGLLARHVVDRLVADGLVVVGLTGSSGKTSTKDLIAALASGVAITVATAGSYNNELGLPLTALRADASTRHLVLEMGARGSGHIAALCALAPPRVGAVLNVGSAHVGEFGGREGIAAAKSELVRALPPAAEGGVAVLNADDPFVAAMSEVTTARVVTFGTAASADVRARDVVLDDEGRPSYTLTVREGEAVPVRLPLHGAHHVANSLAAVAVARELGCPPAAAATMLATVTPASRWRMEVTRRADGLTIVNDAYNANPESMRAALEALVAMAGGRRTVAVLGEMRELGAASDAEHERTGRLVRGLGVDQLVVVGEGATAVHAGALAAGAVDGEGSVVVPDVAAAVTWLRPRLGATDVVLVKASRGVALERVAEALMSP